MRQPRLYALVRLPDGRIVKQPVDTRGAEKLGRRMVQDSESKLWLYKSKLRYQDERNREETP